MRAIARVFCALFLGRGDQAIGKEELAGRWSLQSIEGGSLEEIGFTTHEITLFSDGNWEIWSKLASRFGGMRLMGRGTWSLDGTTLRITTDSRSDVSLVTLDTSRLVLNPDPVVRRNGTDPVVTTYVRQ